MKIILDTDMGNEIDDMFALVYLLASKELELKALTIAPFAASPIYPGVSLAKANDISYDLTMKILELSSRMDLKNRVFRGAETYYYEDPSKTNPAVEAMQNILISAPDTVIAAIGTPVNVSLLFNLYPELAKTTKVVWLGGNGLGYPCNKEFNFSQDQEAVRKLYSSCRNLTIMPCKNVASNLACSQAELSWYLEGSVLGDFLIEQLLAFQDVELASTVYICYTKVLWDISVIAYLINSSWFETVEMGAPLVNDDETYSFIEGRPAVTFVVNLIRNPLMNDFFSKLIGLFFR